MCISRLHIKRSGEKNRVAVVLNNHWLKYHRHQKEGWEVRERGEREGGERGEREREREEQKERKKKETLQATFETDIYDRMQYSYQTCR